MAEFNPYHLYSMASSQGVQDNTESKKKELEPTVNAFLNFHKPETFEERQKFVNDALQGRKYNQTLEFDGETMDFEFVDNVVTVTLHSKDPGRDNKYFKYAT